MTQAALARRVGVAQQTIARLVSGESYGSRYLHLIARELETTPAWLTRETDDPDSHAAHDPITGDEREWLDAYHAVVRERLLPRLDGEPARQWLMRRTEPL